MVVIISFLLLFIPKISQAGFLDSALNEACLASGQCGLADIEAGFSNIIELMLGALGAVALAYFIWGAIQWLTSGGNQERITKGKNIMIGTSMAIFVTLGSYLFVNFFINDVLDVKPDYEVSSIPSECEGRPEGAQCNLGESNYVCTGDYFGNTCISECDLYNSKLEALSGIYSFGHFAEELSMTCETLPPDLHPNFYVEGLCPGGADNVCLMRWSGDGEIFLYNTATLTNINSVFQHICLLEEEC